MLPKNSKVLIKSGLGYIPKRYNQSRNKDIIFKIFDPFKVGYFNEKGFQEVTNFLFNMKAKILSLKTRIRGV